MTCTPSNQQFIDAIEKKAEETGSKLVLALDPDFALGASQSALFASSRKLIEDTSNYVCAIKINYHLIIPFSLNELRAINEFSHRLGLATFADLKLNDIGNTNRVACDYLWEAGFSGVIVNPFAGYEEGLDSVFSTARKLGKGVITLAYMSHKGADETYSLILENGKSIFQLFLERAKSWGSDGVVVGSTRPERIRYARDQVGSEIKIFSPGSGVQGGDLVSSLRAGADYLIVGRSILNSKSPEEEVRQLRSKLRFAESHQRP